MKECKNYVTKENIESLGFYENDIWDDLGNNWEGSIEDVYVKLEFGDSSIYLDMEGKKGIITYSTDKITVEDLYRLINIIK